MHIHYLAPEGSIVEALPLVCVQFYSKAFINTGKHSHTCYLLRHPAKTMNFKITIHDEFVTETRPVQNENSISDI